MLNEISRRKFLKTTAYLGFTGMLLPAFMSACESKRPTPEATETQTGPPFPTPEPAAGAEPEDPFSREVIRVGDKDVVFGFHQDFSEEEKTEIKEVVGWFSETYGDALNDGVEISSIKGEVSDAKVQGTTAMVRLAMRDSNNEAIDQSSKMITIANELSTALYGDERAFADGDPIQRWENMLYGEGRSSIDSVLYGLSALDLSYEEIIQTIPSLTLFAHQEIFDYIPPAAMVEKSEDEGPKAEDTNLKNMILFIWERTSFTSLAAALASSKPENVSFQDYVGKKEWQADMLAGQKAIIEKLRDRSEQTYAQMVAEIANEEVLKAAYAQFPYLQVAPKQDDGALRPLIARLTNNQGLDKIGITFFIGGLIQPEQLIRSASLKKPVLSLESGEVFVSQARLEYRVKIELKVGYLNSNGETKSLSIFLGDYVKLVDTPEDFGSIVTGVTVENIAIDLDTDENGQVEIEELTSLGIYDKERDTISMAELQELINEEKLKLRVREPENENSIPLELSGPIEVW